MTYGCVPLSHLPDDPHGAPDHPAWRRALVDFTTLSAQSQRIQAATAGRCRAPSKAFVRVVATLQALNHGIGPDEIFTRSRKRRVCYPRMRAIKELRDAGYSYPSIASHWAMDHTSAIHAVRRIEYLDGLRT